MSKFTTVKGRFLVKSINDNITAAVNQRNCCWNYGGDHRCNNRICTVYTRYRPTIST